MIEVRIGKNDAGQRLDKFLMKSYSNLPPSLMFKAIRQKKIKVNRARAEQNTRLNEGDVLQIFLPEEFFSSSSVDDAFLRLEPQIDVLYEEQQKTGTLIDHIKAYLYRKGEYDPASERSFAPALCNRIDRNTSGIVLAAKDAESLRVLNEQIRNGGLDKRYLCAAHGVFEKKNELLSGWLVKDGEKNVVRVYDEKPPSGDAKEIRTEYTVLKQKSADRRPAGGRRAAHRDGV